MNFERATITGDDGRAVSGYACTCDKCGHTDTIKATGHTKSLPADVTRRKFIQRGWRITSKVRRCPTCLKPTAKPEKPVMAHAEPPRQPSPADKRRIFREIDENWDEGKSRYSGSTTDQTLADSLSVPRAWVTTIREDAFGKSQRNEDLDKPIGNLKNLKGDCDRAMASAMELAEKFEALSKQAADMQAKVNAVV